MLKLVIGSVNRWLFKPCACPGQTARRMSKEWGSLRAIPIVPVSPEAKRKLKILKEKDDEDDQGKNKYVVYKDKCVICMVIAAFMVLW